MKKISALFFVCLIPGFLLAQWTTTGSTIINSNSGDVKISSSSRIYLNGGGLGLIYEPMENAAYYSRYFMMFDYTNNASYPFLTNRTPSGKVVIKTGTASGGGENTHFTVEGGDGTVNSYFQNTRVGIGTVSPTYSLDVVGDIGVSQYLRHNDDSNTYLRFQGDDLQMYAGGDQILRADEDSSPTLTFGSVWDTKFNGSSLYRRYARYL